MTERLYNRRFTIFLISFLITLFGNLMFPERIRENAETVLLLQNMLFGILLFKRQSKSEMVFISVIVLLAVVARFNRYYMEQNSPFIFAGIYVIYFSMISFRLFLDIRQQRVVGIETISGVFCGFILLSFMSSILFVSLDSTLKAFSGPTDNRAFSDFLYFSFITLLTIGYGDITPTTEISKRLVVFVGLLGHFYTVFVTAIIVGKYLSRYRSQ